MDTEAGRVFAKAARRLIPFMALLYVVSFLDRVNVGFAALTMNKDLGFSPEVYGFGAGIFFFGYFLFEVPSNIILEKVGARLWICRIMLTWGLVSMATAFVQGAFSFYVVRFLLGLAEAGFFPGMVLYLTYWFPTATRARFIALFLAAVPLASVVGGPVSGFILGVEGHFHLHGWQWLFLLEGLPSVLLGLAVLVWMPDRPSKAFWLSDREKSVVEAALAREQQGTHTRLLPMLSDPRVWLLAVPDFGIVLGLYGLNLWLPQMVKEMGFSNLETGFVVAAPYLVSSVVMVIWGMSSDARNERVWHISSAALLGAAGLTGAALLHTPVAVLISLTIAACGIYAALAVFWTLPTSFLGGTAAAGGIALINSISNTGGFFGPYLMGWLKSHTGGYSAGLGVLAGALVIAAILVVVIGRTLTFAGRAQALEKFTRMEV
jgi:ACS family tartrate transporter-like MFS transporter